VIARGYAVVDDRDGNLITTAQAARAARAVRLFFADADVDATISDES
jgi:exonuclease VII large subunit